MPIIYLFISFIGVGTSFTIIKIILDRYYRFNSQYGGAIVNAIDFFKFFKEQTHLGVYLDYLIIIIATFFVYYLIIRKTLDSLLTIIDVTNQMAAGDLEKTIDIDCKGDIKTLGDNINIISLLLKNVTIEERKAQQTKTDLITNVSHDIKTPLTSIINYIDLLKKENLQDSKVQHYIEVLEQKAQRLKVLTEDVVEASKVSSGNVTLEYMRINFVEMIQQTSGEFEEKFKKRRLQEILRLPDEDISIWVDGRSTWRILDRKSVV